MKKANKILSVFLALVMVLSIFSITASAAAYGGTCGDNLTWSYDASTCVLTISGTGDMANYKYNNRPWETYEDKIKTVVINDGVTNIGNYAFYSCGALANITIPDSVTSIKTFAFFGCKSLTQLPIGNNVTSIGTNAFQSCTGLVSVTLPDSITTISSSLFQGCTALTNVTMSNNVTAINNSAFQGCKGLVEITIPDSVTRIASLAFADCEKLANITMGKTVTSIDGSVFSNCKSLKSFVIPEKVTTISSGLFQYCTSLESVTIPDTVTSIGDSAFRECTSLTSITVPIGVETIGALAFYDCTALTDVYYSGSEYQWNKITIGDNNPSLDTATKHFGVSSIVSGLCGKYVQWSYNLASGVLTISGTGEMYNYSSNNAPWQEYKSEITTLVIEDGVTTIGTYAFYSCEKLSTVTFSDSVTTIGDKAFYKCNGLISIYIPGTVTSIGQASFSVCDNLKSVIIGDGVTTISNGAFSFCETLTDVTIGNAVTTIGEGAFKNCVKLQSVTIPDSVTTIEKDAFRCCTVLESVTIGSGVKSIGESAFELCKGLETITIPDSVTSIEDDAFYSCIALTSVTIGNGLTKLDYELFANCTSLTNVTFGDNVEEIGYYVFSDCESLTCINIPETVTTIEIGAFRGSGLTSVIIPVGVTTINEQTFQGCDYLTAVYIPDTVTTIYGNAFNGCNKLVHIYYAGTEEQWNSITINDSDGIVNSKKIHFNSDHVHEFEPTVTAPTCTDRGYTTYTCHCDYSYRDDYVNATGHGSVSSVVTPPTCTEDGYTTYTCHCGEVYVSDYVDAGHKPSSTVVISEASCTTNGEYEHTCGRCGETYTETIIAQGHKEVVLPAVPPTSTSSGLTEGSKCSVCGEMFIAQEIIPALNHCGENVKFSYNTSTGCLTIYGTGPMYDFKSNNRPWEEYEDNIKKVVVEEGVTSIGANAFYSCAYITSVTLPDGLTEIRDYAFERCSSLTSINIPDSVKSIGIAAFYYCQKLKSINIPDGITTISADAFVFCKSLTEITIPSSVTTIGEDAFYACDGLTEVVIPDSVITIGDGAFRYCDGLTSVTIGTGVTTIGDSAFYRCDGLTTITIPKNVTTIGRRAFADCKKLVSIIVDKDNQHFINDEFGVLFNKDKTILLQYPMANTITKYAIPSGVTTICEMAFYDCTTLTSITLPDSLKIIERSAFSGCDGITSLIIPDGVITIDESAIRDCTNLKDITIPDSVTTIGGYAITSFKIIIHYGGTANQWKQLMANNQDAETFYLKENMVYCSDETILPSGECGDNLTWTYNVVTGTLTISGIGDMYHFEYFSKFDEAENPWWTYRMYIKNVVIGDGVTSIGGYSFYRCDNLKTIYYKGTQRQWNKILIGSHNQPLVNAGIHYNSTETHQPDYTLVVTAPTCTEQGYTTYNCYCGGYCVDNYVYKLGHTDNDNNEYCEICNEYIYIATGTCGDNLTWGFNESTDTLIISGTGRMYDYYNNAPWKSYQYKIKKVIINDGVTKIGDYAFNYCTDLTSVIIPYSVNWVYFNAFGYCSNLTDVYYCGAEEEWKSISILSLNEPLLNATIHYNYGKFTGIKDNHFYKDDVMQKAYQLVEFNGDFYYIGDKHELIKGRKAYLSAERINGLTYADGTPIEPGYYNFDENGKMVILNGIVGNSIYKNNTKLKAYQLVEIDGDFYFIGDRHEIVKNKRIYLNEARINGLTYADGTPITPGYYNVDENGKLVILNGIVGNNIYKNNAQLKAYQLVEVDGDFYFIGDRHEIVKNKKIYLNEARINGLTYEDGTPITVGYYNVDADGKLIIG